MSQTFAILIRFSAIILGFAAAALSASAFLHVVLIGPGEITAGEPAGAGAYAFSVVFVALLVAYFAFTPAIAAILIGEFMPQRGWLYYSLCGAAISAVVSALVYGARMGEAEALADKPLLSFIGAGLIAGMVYWAVCGRNAGRWREPPRADTEPPPGG